LSEECLVKRSIKKDNAADLAANVAGYQINNDPNFDRKLDLALAGAKPYIREHLLTKISRELQNYSRLCFSLINRSDPR
jgi:hypothetical protein